MVFIEEMKVGKVISNQERESLFKLAKRRVGEEKRPVRVMEQTKVRLQLNFLPGILRNPKEFRHP